VIQGSEAGNEKACLGFLAGFAFLPDLPDFAFLADLAFFVFEFSVTFEE
jgi:hypothetical protein